MPFNSPRLRDSAHKRPEPYPLNNPPKQIITEMAKRFVYLFAVGKSDISGEEWGDVFSHAVDGDHLASPVGLADVVKEGFSWSVKSVKQQSPHQSTKFRAISGRNSPDYSYGITDPHKDVQKTGNAVLGIWNERVRIGLEQHDGLRIAFLIRNFNTLEFTFFEREAEKYSPSDYIWSKNSKGNFEAKDSGGIHRFTWQPHGGQFTIIYPVPIDSLKFHIKRPHTLDFEKVVTEIGFSDDWVSILNNT